MKAVLAVLVCGVAVLAQTNEPVRDAMTVLSRRCLGCHSGKVKMSGLDLSVRDAALRGGASGPALSPGEPDGSLLLQKVLAGKMPPAGPLPRAEKDVLRAWISDGAPWGSPAASAPRRADSNWWSLQPVTAKEPPSFDDLPPGWEKSSVDKWIFAKLREKGMRPNAPADRRTLIRRLTFDLTGLPPTPSEIETFLADERPDAYARLVDRLLASPRYGERWARHWLDVARFTESQGFERDLLRENGWRYRDYVIRSFNDDKPYDQFVREQIAGDVLEPITHDGIVATGFLVAGPYDYSSLFQKSDSMRERAREDQQEDLLSVVSQSFLGLTVNCARCHDHKFDPILQRDYYALKSVFDGVWHGDRPVLTPVEQQKRNAWEQMMDGRIGELESAIASLRAAGRDKVLAQRNPLALNVALPIPMAQWTFDYDLRDSRGKLHGEGPDESMQRGRVSLPKGYSGKSTVTTKPLERELREKTLEVWLSVLDASVESSRIMVVENDSPFIGEKTNDSIRYSGNQKRLWLPGSDGDYRTKQPEGEREGAESGAQIQIAIAYRADNSIAVYRNGKPYGASYVPDGDTDDSKLQTFLAGLGRIHFQPGPGIAIEEARLYDSALSADQIRALHQAGIQNVLLEAAVAALDKSQSDRLKQLENDLAATRKERAGRASAPLAYAAVSKQPGQTLILLRGSVATKGDVVSPSGISTITAVSPDLGLSPDSEEGERRIRFARWITDAKNPLTPRVMVNRIWHYHFGAGLVSNPNDFGFNGGQPSHPELLDLLAGQFIASGWSVKSLHRIILLSQTYRQSAAENSKHSAIDAGNLLLWKYPARRLEGESIRDAMLAISGRIQHSGGGPGFRPFTTRMSGTTQIYDPREVDEPAMNRRAVYRMNINSAADRLLEAFDCPSPAVKTPKRILTTTPRQALSLMNSVFVQTQAQHLADRIRRESGESAVAQVQQAFLLGLGRLPRDQELRSGVDLVKTEGLETLCWGLFNTSEFLYVN